MSQPFDPVTIGIVSVSDRASSGAYEDQGLPALQDWLTRALKNPIRFEPRLIPDEQATISQTLIELVDAGCALVLTTGGTGPARRDVTPEATLAVADKEMPGFGEQMRQISLRFVPTAILSRQVAVVRGQSLIINLPGQPKAIAETLEGLKDNAGNAVVHGIFAAVPYCVDLIGGPYLETDDAECRAFRKSAVRSAPLNLARHRPRMPAGRQRDRPGPANLQSGKPGTTSRHIGARVAVGVQALSRSALVDTRSHAMMKIRHYSLAALLAATLAAAGCSTSPTNAQIGTGVGAVAGGVIGSAVGGTAATIGGAAVGAVVGHEVGRRAK